MRWSSVLSEAWRDLVSGTTRALLLVCIAVALFGSLAAVDVRALVSVARDASEFRAAGASTQVVTLSGGIDGARCAALADVAGVSAAGALRAAAPLRVLSLPSGDVPQFEVTPGFFAVLDEQTVPEPGVAISQSLATTLGATPGSSLATTKGSSVVRSVYQFPEDGRTASLTYAVLSPVPIDGRFDACWAEIWPVSEQTSTLMLLATEAIDGDESPSLSQLNPRLGRDIDTVSAVVERPTRLAGVGAALLGLGLGVAAVRSRRLELASALHSRVPKATLTWQVLVETAVWVASAFVVLAPLIAVAASVGNPEPALDFWVQGLEIVGAGSGGVLLGAVAMMAITRERHLFRFFKER